MVKPKIFIGSDHAGIDAKDKIKYFLTSNSYEVFDCGTHSKDPVDYPVIAKKVCGELKHEGLAFGILICGSGTGMQIAANKQKKIRASICYDTYSAKMSRSDNNANVLCLRAREFDQNMYEEIVNTFLETPFSNKKRHQNRINQLE